MREVDFTTQISITLQNNQKQQALNAEILTNLFDSRFHAIEALKNVNTKLLSSIGVSTTHSLHTSFDRSEAALSSVSMARKLNCAKDKAKYTKSRIQITIEQTDILNRLKQTLLDCEIENALELSSEYNTHHIMSMQASKTLKSSLENELLLRKNEIQTILNEKLKLALDVATTSAGESEHFFHFIEIFSKVEGFGKVIQYLSVHAKNHIWKSCDNICSIFEKSEVLFRQTFLSKVTYLFDDTLEFLERHCKRLGIFLDEKTVSEYAVLCHEECSAAFKMILNLYIKRRKFDLIDVETMTVEVNEAFSAQEIDIFLEEISNVCAQYEQYHRLYFIKITEICKNSLFKLSKDNFSKRDSEEFEKIYRTYSWLESLYIQKSISIAIEMEEYGNYITSSIVDDALFISERSAKRALRTESFKCVHSVLVSLNSIFIQHIFTMLSDRLTSRVKFTKPDLLIELTEIHELSSENSETRLKLCEFVRGLNDVDAMGELVLKLGDILSDSAEFCTRNKEKECILHWSYIFKETSSKFKKLCTNMLQRVSGSYVDVFGSTLQFLSTLSYVFSHDKYEECYETWTGQIIETFQKIVQNLLPIISIANLKKLVDCLLEELARRIEMIVMTRLRFNHLGGLRFEREIRKLVANLAGFMQCQTRDIFSRLSQIGMVLSFEAFDEITDYWGDRAGLLTWHINRSEVKRILQLRVDFRLELIESLQL